MHSQRVLFEISWEVCNMVGGIHTVLATRVPEMEELYGEGYITMGPDIPRRDGAIAEFRPDIWSPELAESLASCGVGVAMGRWLVPGEPRCLLVNHTSLYNRKDQILGEYWEEFQLDSLFGAWDYFDPVLFAHAAGMVIEHIREHFLLPRRQGAVVHAHEWMSGASVLYLKTRAPDIGTVFTTHATMLGRSMAGHHADPNLYESLKSVDAVKAARELNVSSKHSMECVVAREADVFTTVSEITAFECEHLLGRRPDVLPNGFGAKEVTPTERQRARDALFNLAELTTGDQYDRDHTLLLILAGRYEYVNKGVDVYLDAVHHLVADLKARDGKRVIAFATLPAGHAEPKRELWNRAHGDATSGTPLRCTHHLVDEPNDPITNQLNALRVENNHGDPVHVVHVPIYLDGTDPLIRHKYWDLLPGADLGVFPSFYEPWGYTPLEAIAFGVPAITTDRAGFGRWVAAQGDVEATGVEVLKREGVPTETVRDTLTRALVRFLDREPSAREQLRSASLDAASRTAWSNFISHYRDAHENAYDAAAERRRELPMERLSAPGPSPEASGAFWIAEKLAQKEGEDSTLYTRMFTATNALPDALKPLRELGSNLWWRWHPRAAVLFEQLEPSLWAESNENPTVVLDGVPIERLEELAGLPEYVEKLLRVREEFKGGVKADDSKIAYFCMEFGLAGFLKIYSGGLGILAGDHLKAASDLGIPLCAVGLAYREGYFRQLIDREGQQEALSDAMDFHTAPFEQVMIGRYAPLKVTVPMPSGPVQAQAWQLNVGRTRLYLLDTDLPENRPEDRLITNRLYGGDAAHRLRQEIVLGLGGYALLNELDIEPDVFHMNEGHSAFLLLARAAHLIQRHGLRSQEALEYVRNTTIFTTHTPVPAGHDHFSEEMVRPHLARYEPLLRLDWSRLMAMGHTPLGAPAEFGTTALATRCAGRINGVSARHGQTTREMFLQFYPDYKNADDVPVTSVTNGVHVPTWLAPRWQEVVTREMGAEWRDKIDDPDRWQWIRELDPAEVWTIHRELRADLVSWLKQHLTETWTRRREDPRALRNMLTQLDSDGPIIGFARRFAPYKRADLLLEEPDRLARMLKGNPGAIIAYAGKAHPADGVGRDLLRRVYETSKHPDFSGRVVFIENYDIDAARRMTAGCDVWLNTPTRPLEASGTSGMKAAMNGCLNLSVDDGWWPEGYTGDNGWVIELPSSSIHDPSAFDRATVLALLEGEVLPAYMNRNKAGIPLDWVARIKASMSTIIPRFSARRMVSEYADRFYEPAAQDARELRDSNYRPLFALAALRERIRSQWAGIAMESVRFAGLEGDEVPVGTVIAAELSLHHPGLDADDLDVEAVIRFGSKVLDQASRVVVPFEGDGKEERSTWRGSFTVRASGGHRARFRVRPRQRRDVRPAGLGLYLQKWL